MKDDQEMRQAWLNRLAAGNEENFIDEGFGSLDTSALPSLRQIPDPVPDGPDGDEHGFGRLQGVGHPGGIMPELGKMIEQSADDPQLARELALAGVENPGAPRKFHAAHEWTVTMRAARGKYHFHAEHDDGRVEDFTLRAEDADSAMISACRYLQRDEPRVISQEDLNRLQRMAQHDVQSALGEFLRLRLPKSMADELADTDDIEGFLSRPVLQPIFREAILSVWFWYTPAAQLSDEFLNYLDSFAAGRVLSFQLVESAWLAFLDRREHERRAQTLGLLHRTVEETEPQVPDFEALSDEEIALLQRETMLERARRVRGR